MNSESYSNMLRTFTLRSLQHTHTQPKHIRSLNFTNSLLISNLPLITITCSSSTIQLPFSMSNVADDDAMMMSYSFSLSLHFFPPPPKLQRNTTTKPTPSTVFRVLLHCTAALLSTSYFRWNRSSYMITELDFTVER